MAEERSTDGVRTYTVRLELADEPGELLGALEPIAEAGANLVSVRHEREDLTPRGRVPVTIDLECPERRFDDLVAGLQDAGVTVVRAGSEAYTERLSVLLVGHLVDTDLSETLNTIEACPAASVVDMSLSAAQGTDDPTSARIRLAVESGGAERALETVREIADRKDLRAIEPLVSGGRP